MSNRTKISFVKSAKEPLSMYHSWCDGLWGAVTQLDTVHKFKVRVYGLCDQQAYFEREGIEFHLGSSPEMVKYRAEMMEPRVMLAWGPSSHTWREVHNQYAQVRVLLHAGGDPDNENARKIFNEVVVETPSDAQYFDDCPVAFGTNTEAFYPMEDVDKKYPSIYPAAFALWKRQDLWAKAMPAGSIAIGEKQEHEKECYEVCLENGHIVRDRKPMTELVEYYNKSQGVCLTPEHMGGCQRSALEAMACNVPVLVTEDSKAAEIEGVWTCPPDVENIRNAYLMMILNFYNSPIDLRKKYIVGKMDHIEYGKKLNEIIRGLL